MRAAILTISDKGAIGERVDTSGPAIRAMLEESGSTVACYEIIPDDLELIKSKLIEIADGGTADIIFTTGGTGFAPRDVTPEATLAVVERLVPGIPEAIRLKSLEITPRAMLSRATAGIRGRTLIVNLPGSEKAVRESLTVIQPVLPHAIEILTEAGGECGR